jgi:hypothetical protein
MGIKEAATMAYPAPTPPYVGPPHYFSGGENKPIHRIVLHGTVSPCEEGGARKIAALFREGRVKGSCHYVVDPGEVVQAAYDSVICFHAPPNRNSIGIEMCDWVAAPPDRRKPLPITRWKRSNYARMMRHTARLTAELCLAYNVPMVMRSAKELSMGRRGVCEHDDVSRAWGQSSHWDLGTFPRLRFIRTVRAEAAKITNPPPELQPTRVTKARELIEESIRLSKNAVRRARLQRALKEMPLR